MKNGKERAGEYERVGQRRKQAFSTYIEKLERIATDRRRKGRGGREGGRGGEGGYRP